MARRICVHSEFPRASMVHRFVAPCSLRRTATEWIYVGAFDASIHISEEVTNATVAVPWAIICAYTIGGVLGWGWFSHISPLCYDPNTLIR
jgi:hypothetical protein